MTKELGCLFVIVAVLCVPVLGVFGFIIAVLISMLASIF